jgi:hypothetical protein
MVRPLAILLVVLGLGGALAIRVVVAGRDALAAGDAAAARGRPREAIRAYETAARWYLPRAPHVDETYGRLRALAASSDPAVSLAAWRAIRGAARPSRSLWTPHASDLAAADAAIATRSAAVPGAATTDVAWHRDRLARDARAGIAGLVLAAAGLLLWLGGGVLLVVRGTTAAGTLARRPALACVAAIVLGVGLWAAGLYNA